jgi:putative hydrolase of the HAD superfamily
LAQPVTGNILASYKHLFFDLDNTLWDFRANAHEAFHEIFMQLGLFSRIPDFARFLLVYEQCNEHLWSEYRKGKMKKDVMRIERMLLTFKEMGVDDPELARQVGEIYLHTAPKKANLFPEVPETLEYLSGKYALHILTNGFAEIQIQKINNSGLQGFFTKLFMAEMVGYQKPDRRFFEYAIKSLHAHKSESLMIGDDPDADIAGAAHAGIDQVFFNHDNKSCVIQPTWEIKSFGELRSIL